MTVCIAALFNFNYGTEPGKPDWGKAAIAASDRMLTSGDVQYEPPQQKIALAGTRAMLLVAGDISTHSQAIKQMHVKVPGDVARNPEDIAMIYGREIQAIRRKVTEDIYLSPFNLNTDSFIAQQKDLSEGFVNLITAQLQDFKGEDVDALVVGMEGNAARLYSVDKFGIVTNCEDIGFAAIGIGSWHARSRFMQAGFANHWTLASALATVIAAKKAADIAPGVGKVTDINLIFRDGVRPIWPNVAKKVEALYAEFEEGRSALVSKAIQQLQGYLDDPSEKPADSAPAKTDATRERDSEAAGCGPSESAEDQTEGAEPVQGEKPH